MAIVVLEIGLQPDGGTQRNQCGERGCSGTAELLPRLGGVDPDEPDGSDTRALQCVAVLNVGQDARHRGVTWYIGLDVRQR